jgi:hypothetical protein
VKRIHAGGERHLTLIDISQASKHTLVQQRQRNLLLGIFQSISDKPSDSIVNRKILRQNGRAKLRHLAASFQRSRGMKLRHGHIESHRLPICGSNDYSHPISPHLPSFTRAVEMPTPAHQHVCRENEIAGEINQAPLST